MTVYQLLALSEKKRMFELLDKEEYTYTMTQNTKYLWIIVAIIVVGFGAFYMGRNSSSNTPQGDKVAATSTEKEDGGKQVTTTAAESKATTQVSGTKTTEKTTSISTVSTAGFRTYGSADYSFTIKFPSYVQVRPAFSTFHELSNNWRLYADPANQGKGVVELSIFSLDQGVYSSGHQKYPLYFTALVRVGVGPNVKECYATDSGYTNQKVTNVTINGVTFKRFSTSDAAMMKYVQAESYRTIHNNMCYVIEQIKNGSSYRDEKMAPGISDTALNDYYNAGETIAKTFRFTK